VVEGDAALARGLSLSLTIPLTFFDHGQGEAAQAEAEALSLEASADGLSRQQRAEASAARARLQELSSGVADLGQARNDARELLTQAQRLYAAGEASITEMLEAFRAAEEAQLAELDRAFEIALARLSVMRATGTMFDATLDRACIGPELRRP
jgi:outer membrane protein TolC